MKAIRTALENLRPLKLDRTLGDYYISVEVALLGKAARVWNQHAVIQVRQEQNNVVKLKNCKDMDELRWYLGG